MSSDDFDGLSEVELKLFRLARAARARVEVAEGAAVVDETGRTYSGATVAMPHQQVSALGLAVANAAAAGAREVAGAVIVGLGAATASADAEVFADLAGPGAVLVRCAADQRVLARWPAP